jgi:hypothetical protein
MPNKSARERRSLIYNNHNMLFFCIFLLSIARGSSGQPQDNHSGKPTAEILRTAYQHSFDDWQTIHFKGKTNLRFEGDFKNDIFPAERVVEGEDYRDGIGLRSGIKIIRHDMKQDSSISSSTVIQTVVDSSRMISFESPEGIAPDSVAIRKVGSLGTRTFDSYWGNGEVLNGQLSGQNGQTTPEILETATTMAVKEEMEEVNGHKTWVLGADTPHGKITLWIDPECGYNPRRILLEQTGDDIHNGKPLSTPPPPLPFGGVSSRPHSRMVRFEELADNIEIEKVNDVFIPVGCSTRTSEFYENGEETHLKSTHKRTHIDLNPDFDAIGAFVLDVPNGTPVHDLDFQAVSYVWQDGTYVPMVDEELVSAIQQESQEIKSEMRFSEDLSATQKSHGGNAPDQPTKTIIGKTSIGIAIGLIAGVIIAIAIGYRIHRMRKTDTGNHV